MSSNLLKFGYHYLPTEEKRIIDSNEAVEMKLNENRIKESANYAAELETETEEFVGGLDAERIELLVDPNEEDKELQQVDFEHSSEYEEMKNKALDECKKMKEDAEREIEKERESIFEEAKKQGYIEGQAQATREIELLKKEHEQKLKEIEAEYDEKLSNIEPQLISTLTDIYEHIFRVDFSSDRQIIASLLSNAIRNIDGVRNYMVHVSSSDYPYVSSQKAQILGNMPGSITVEFIEDITLNQNQCYIETENGIFDCGLGTQLEELKRKLQLLSFER